MHYERTTYPDNFILKFVVNEIERAKKASTISLNTFEKLEYDVIDVLSSILPPICVVVVPLHYLQNQINNNDLRLLGSNLWKEKLECLEWLDLKEPKSCAYVNFGSVTVKTPKQLVEFAWGLAYSNQTFLWIIIPDLLVDDLGVFPPEFVEETKDRG
ncbi:unnamed protein product [Ilex paraguariensis]|uniref:Uncharacterized protein n=1 Tax=Ilex paraguariensis TaxID=185542 RepID=A0ABC8RL62_9AQUA